MLKKILSIFTLIILLSTSTLLHTASAESNDGYFIVTAYYSPLPNQSKYIMGNYEAEVRMNGQGYRGAGGKKVFSGMLAAPSIYKFGTKIYLDGVGIGEVADRGGAIVKSGERNFSHDRIDIWVGHGEEGLQRAMYWGKRKIKGNIVKESTNGTINIKKMYAPKWATSYLPENQKYIPKISHNITKDERYSFFNYGIGTKSSKESIVLLQKFLKEINIYNGKTSGIYNTQLMNNIYAFQKENNIVTNWLDINAGYWSSKTRAALWKKYSAGDFMNTTSSVKITKGKVEVPKIALQTKIEKKTIVSIEQKTELIDIFSKPISNKEGVERLQRILVKLGFYKGSITGEYIDVRASVLNFQLANKIIINKNSLGAGNYGPSTRKILDKSYKQYGLDKKTDNTIQSIILELEDKQENIIKSDNKEQKERAKVRIGNLGNIKFGDISHGVRDFQIILNTLGFFEQRDTAIFGPQTKQALIDYQLNRKIISDVSIYGSGLLGPKTKAQLIKDLGDI